MVLVAPNVWEGILFIPGDRIKVRIGAVLTYRGELVALDYKHIEFVTGANRTVQVSKRSCIKELTKL